MVNLLIRAFTAGDLDKVVELSVLAFEPVFRSFERTLGPRIYPLVHPDWRKRLRAELETNCRDEEKANLLVSEVDGRVAGFLDYRLHEAEKRGEIRFMAVHPQYQNRDIGTELNSAALQRMKAAGMRLAQVSTGGAEVQAPARRSYEKAGFTALPLVRYYKKLSRR
jgi:ribosomal protein S18 acetylase RimI-like enzyme